MTRLNDHAAQETYYHKIVDRYMKFCADRGNVKELEKAFATASLLEATASGAGGSERARGPSNGKLQKPQAESATAAAQTELQTLLHAMRKLREAIVASHRCDVFAQRAYIFIIRAAILVRHLQSYHPALQYLLRIIHPRQPLPASELNEFIGYYILDLCCRLDDLHTAYAIRQKFNFRDRRVDKILYAVVHEDWVVFWRVRKAVDGHQRALIESKVDAMRMHALRCIGRTYMTVEKDFLEKSADLDWKGLVKRCGVGWELDSKGELVTIRKPKVSSMA